MTSDLCLSSKVWLAGAGVRVLTVRLWSLSGPLTSLAKAGPLASMGRTASCKGWHASAVFFASDVFGGRGRVSEGKSRSGRKGECKHMGEWQRGQSLPSMELQRWTTTI